MPILTILSYLMPMLTVMGMLGAFGKMNLVSSNLFFERKWSARNILYTVDVMSRVKYFASYLPSCAAVHMYQRTSRWQKGKISIQVLPVPKPVSDYHR